MAFPWPDVEKPMMFYSQLGIEEISVSGTSFLNRTGRLSVSFLMSHSLCCGVCYLEPVRWEAGPACNKQAGIRHCRLQTFSKRLQQRGPLAFYCGTMLT